MSAHEAADDRIADDGTSSPFEAERAALLGPILDTAVFDGFTEQAMARGCAAAGLRPAELAAAFPGGVGDLLRYWSACADAASRAALVPEAVPALRIREKVARGVEARLAFFAPRKEAARRAAAALALPHRAGLAADLVWRAADAVWRAMGDKSTDFNFYSKRAILSGVIASTQTRWFGDDDPAYEETKRFLAGRIENVMQFEKAKARVSEFTPDLSGFIRAAARARYR